MRRRISQVVVALGMLAVAISVNASGCHPLSVDTCAMPYPSDYYTVADDVSPTGLRTQYDESLFRPEVLEQMPVDRGFSIDDLINGDSGFSANSPVVFEMPQSIDRATVPLNGNESVIAINVTTGERTLIRSIVSFYAEYSLFVKSSDVIEVSPRGRWEFGDQYIIAVTQQVKDREGNDISPLMNFTAALNGEINDQKFTDVYKPGLLALQAAGVDLSSVITATAFTVRDRAEVVDPMLTTAKHVYQNSHPVREMKVHYTWFGKIGAIVTGEVRLDNYREDMTGIVNFKRQPQEQWVDFTLLMPRLKKGEKAPVAISGHQIAGVKELSVNAFSNAKLGIATIGINFPNHGDRIFQDGGYAVLNVGFSAKLPQQVGMLTQPTLDYMSLLKAIETELNELDLFPKTWWTPRNQILTLNGDGIADLDLTRITVQGSSLGGVLGTAFASIAPNIKGAYFHVSGVGISNMMSGSILWDLLFATLVPWGSTGAEGLLLRAIIQQEFDYGDSANFADYARNPLPGNLPRPIAVLSGANDYVVPNNTTIALANIADMPLVGEEFYPMPGVRKTADFDEGFGVIQETLPQTNSPADGGLAHVFTVITPRAWGIQEEWIKKYILEE